ncbi:hypothetical protein [Microbacterium ulmi]|uniref:Uncharacterized protein n=1 Tax=Microbacterium ulmi TaxID=179095 RepID=A0A7Y2LYX7_9MICO|nr:hypothetical protein [Microbacterium ulmi]NII70275.1 hypothetical protein [Microbacterium ulmi]NNH03322.1 hypothetical protein [Microbacterium ulmi]
MADLPRLKRFAADHAFGLTAPLTAEQVRTLAEYWLPNLNFHEDERFHPIALADRFDMVKARLDELPPDVREQWRVGIHERGPGGIAVRVPHDPPVLYDPDGVAPSSVGNTQTFRKVRRIIAEGEAARAAMADAAVDGDAFVSSGASFSFANEHFGSTDLLLGGNNAVPGNPWVPRATEPAPGGAPGEVRPRMTVLAQYVNLLDVLRYDVLVSEADADPAAEDYPPDAMRRDFDLSEGLLRHDPDDDPTMPPLQRFQIDEKRRELILSLIEAENAGQSLPPLPPGWTLDGKSWRVIVEHAFLEYSFLYAYNDFERWQTAIFDNEHEGDDEGCCLVFHRREMNLAAQGDIRRAHPLAIITSVHEEYQDADLFQRIPSPAAGGGLGRDGVDLDVFIAGGSHATYLTPGTHDLVDYQDYWGYVDENDLWILAPLVLPISIILAILEHFIDTEDFTSEEGVHGGPGIPDTDPQGVATHVLTIPTSEAEHVYDGAHDDLLLLRAYPGKWGGHDGTVDVSPGFPPKTRRFLKRLLKNL